MLVLSCCGSFYVLFFVFIARVYFRIGIRCVIQLVKDGVSDYSYWEFVFHFKCIDVGSTARVIWL